MNHLTRQGDQVSYVVDLTAGGNRLKQNSRIEEARSLNKCGRKKIKIINEPNERSVMKVVLLATFAKSLCFADWTG